MSNYTWQFQRSLYDNKFQTPLKDGKIWIEEDRTEDGMVLQYYAKSNPKCLVQWDRELRSSALEGSIRSK
ncbi:MAG: hypothetical protein EAZ78_11750 [Oscillatoriales cyanobacterium]|nr:MAG: hypothetical protein EA000_13335 [Oscillatoriales cyanobacterium]TAD97551.1 MAG: hypothetical protein EAZ98_09300 [Oscillatoriales cyanobacterium]TAE06630.1 MAG: hypothetical protein EAZ96_01655 [Oscillatoriales cyanobacterium]TAF03604.1 MAG: hypothetical protein EAZ78_11750 [Oscillatoriales cyanobacterium]TAF47565.1 MAG: hypothetical protein EAZ68_01530 [Oscillatoriales cyanobacterium]